MINPCETNTAVSAKMEVQQYMLGDRFVMDGAWVERLQEGVLSQFPELKVILNNHMGTFCIVSVWHKRRPGIVCSGTHKLTDEAIPLRVPGRNISAVQSNLLGICV